MLQDISNLTATPRRKDGPPAPLRLEVACAEKPEVEGGYELRGEHNEHPQWAKVDGSLFIYSRDQYWWIGSSSQRDGDEVIGALGSEYHFEDGTMPDAVDLWQVPGTETWHTTQVTITAEPDDRTPPPVSLSQEERGKKRELAEALAEVTNPTKVQKFAELAGVDKQLILEMNAEKRCQEARQLIVDPVFYIPERCSKSRRALEDSLGRKLEAGEFHEDVGSAADAAKKARELLQTMLGMLKEDGLAPGKARELLEAAEQLCAAATEKTVEVLAEWFRALGERRRDLVLALVAAGEDPKLCAEFEHLEVHQELPELATPAVEQLLATACQLGEPACTKACVFELRRRDPSLGTLDCPLPAELLEELAAEAEKQGLLGVEGQAQLASRLLLQLVDLTEAPAGKEELWRRVLTATQGAGEDTLVDARQRALTGLRESLLGRAERTEQESEELATLLLQSGRDEEVCALVPLLTDRFLLEVPLVQLAAQCPPESASRLLAAEAERQFQAGSFDGAVLSMVEAEKLMPGRQVRLREMAARGGPQSVLQAMEVLVGDEAPTSDIGLLLRVLRTQAVAPDAAQTIAALQESQKFARTVSVLSNKVMDMGRELEALRSGPAAPTSRLQQGLALCASWSHEIDVANAEPGSVERFNISILGGLQTVTVSVHPYGDGAKNAEHLSVVLRGPKGCKLTATLKVVELATREELLSDRRRIHWQEKSSKHGWAKALPTPSLLQRGTVGLTLEFAAPEEPAAVVKAEPRSTTPGRDEGPIDLEE